MESSKNSAGGREMQVVRFHMGGQQFALDIMQVKEIINPVPITPMPQAPGFVEGIVELRGTFFAVMDLAKRFDLPPRERPQDAKYIVVRRSGRYVGLIVDGVIDVCRLAVDGIMDAPEFAVAEAPETRFVVGVTRWEDDIVMLLDLERLLTEEHMASLPAPS